MSDRDRMLRVSRRKPCPVCGRPDWCLVAEDGSAAICARIVEGSVKKCGEAGYLHILIDRHNGHDRHKRSANKRRLVTNVPMALNTSSNFGRLARQYQQQLTTERLSALANSLNVSAASLQRLTIGWDGNSYTFPMCNDLGNVIGIQRRFLGGRKISVTGSKIGLFVPSDLLVDGILLICEGPTDTAAALDLGYAAIGRPNCNSRIRMVARFVSGREVVIVGDNDDVGRAGAEKLATKLALCCPAVRILYPPASIKDLRNWWQAGLTAEEFSGIILDTEPIKTEIRFKCTGDCTE
jgi:hypothetical protein